MSFHVRGSDDSLFVQPEVGGATVVLRIPVRALPWRDAQLVEKHGPRLLFGCGGSEDPLAGVRVTLRGPQVVDRTGIQGAESLRLENGVAAVQIEGNGPLVIPCLHVANGARVPASVQVAGKAGAGGQRRDPRLPVLRRHPRRRPYPATGETGMRGRASRLGSGHESALRALSREAMVARGQRR